ncbi:uncharacterized protein BDR25DRAFT_20859 [Lindgomyces ingoldianus]|uniref:Uncharacterized protein n=1 Tax=Lindgomyces ingoldianus TaxID=673940 RepID=A0ACB6QZB2_9PLEO|nr:uncharacterized protein BDR25DRAFT_20859 [Lindgomyces ingoldianus]KAF2471531.1 hypothetical protein BDR25DRAFT_20859 [Lindgomyces ingoldianus]
MYRGPSSGGRSKATPTTQCQKCLRRGHYSYECKASTQERPYKSRPSRTQQLLNPQLKPKLMTDVPSDLLRKKGVADELLAKKEEERGRKLNRDGDELRQPSRKRSRSVSSDSVSTISTNLSQSRSRSLIRSEHNKQSSLRGGHSLGKRPRKSPSSDSYHSGSSYDMRRAAERNSRRRLSAFSPVQRGRRRNRSASSSMDTSEEYDSRWKGGRRPRSPSQSDGRALGSRLSMAESRSRSPRRGRTPLKGRSQDGCMDIPDERGPRRNCGTKVVRRTLSRENRRGRSPVQRPRSRSIDRDRHMIRPTGRPAASESRSRSPPRFRNGRESRSRSPFRPARSPTHYSRNTYRARNGGDGNRGGPRGGRGRQFQDRREDPRAVDNAPPAPPPQKERSLSPYSKRLALTQAMMAGGR